MRANNLVGREIRDFVIKERIGLGGMAEVYRAYQPSVNRDIAVKIIYIHDAIGDDAFPKRFAQEAEVIASLEHIHILPIYGYGIDDDIAYLMMRLLRGGSLSDLLKNGFIPLERTVELFGQFAQGLAYAHSKGVIHRDLKPSNIMLDDANNAYLTDFGLAKLVSGGENNLTKSGNVVGTPAYMSPEQLRGEPLDHRSDIYSLGVVLYHMLTGRQPFEASTTDLISVIYKHLEKPPEPPSQINPLIPPEVEAVVLKALAKKPDDRFGSAGLMAQELKIALGLSSSSNYPEVSPRLRTRTSSPAAPTAPSAPKRQLALLIGAVGVIVALAFIALLVINSGSGTASLVETQQAQTAAAAQFTPTPLPKATVLPGQSAEAGSFVPSPDEILTAKQVLGAGGFIAFITCNQSSEYHSAQAREIRDFAAAYGVEARIYDSDTDSYKQLTLIEKARTDGAKGFIICPLDVKLLDTPLKSMQQAGLPVVIFDAGEEKYGAVLLQGSNYQLGLKPGRYAGQIIQNELGGKADVIILDYPDLPIIVERANGLEVGVRAMAPGVNIVGRYLGATRDFGKESVSKLLRDGVQFNVILSINDAGSFGAIDALVEAGIPPDEVIIVSVDAEALALRYIREGYYMRGSVEVGRTQLSKAAADSIIKLLAGATLPETLLVEPGDVVTKTILERRGG